MFRTTHIRTKLAVALAVPMLAVVAVAGYEVLDARTQVSSASSQADLAGASIGPGSLVVSLQDERNMAALDLIGLSSAVDLGVKDNADARSKTDPAVVTFREETASRGDRVASAFAPAWTAFEDLQDLRADIDAYTGPKDTTNQEFADEVFQRYTAIVEAFFDGTSQVVLDFDDADLRNGAAIVDASTRQAEIWARLVRRVVLASIVGTTEDIQTRQDVAALFDRSQSFNETILASAQGPFAGVADDTFAEAGVQSFNQQVESYLAGGAVDMSALLDAAASDSTKGYSNLAIRSGDLLSEQADQLQQDALAREELFGALALGGLVLALLITWLASRSITRPLSSLKDQAEDMAGVRLPSAVRQILDTPPGEDAVIPEVEPIAVKTKDEVSEVAAALSQVQASAVDLAVEQAVLRRNISDSYINLGRRNQNLLSRQLDFITELERNETDPDTLEGLFRLDHLATRMRRNAESLLVLAGIEPPRQWAAPMKVADVVRAALGEVEDYQRVVVRHLEPASLTGAVATDIAHVLAELIENALSFSPPDQSVEVKGRLTTAGYTVAISDNGLGMAAEDVVRANRRLAGKESFTVAPSRYLGHYVAGHLASRLGVAVELQDSPAGGITAKVDIPMRLLAEDELERTLTRPAAPATPEPAPVVAGPSASVAVGHTTNGLARRGERAPALEASDTEPTEPVEPVERVEPTPDTEPVAEPSVPVRAASPPAATPEPAASPEVSTPAPDDEMSGPEPSPATNGHGPVKGFGGLVVPTPTGSSMYSVAAQMGRPEADGDAATPSGLARRVPGAQRPDAGPPARAAEPEATPAEPTRSTPEDVYSFLSNFQSGVARGRADAAADAPTDHQEDGA